MSGKQRVSKERQELEEQSRRALMGLGITSEAAIHGVLAETLRVTAHPSQPKPSVTSSPSAAKTPPPSETQPAASEIPPSPPRAPVAASATTDPSSSLETPLSLESEGERVHNLRLELLDPSPDQPRLKQELINNPKEDAELSMIVDLLRNDLNHVEKESSAQVTAHREVMKLGYIQHTYSEIEIETDKSLPEILRSTMPGGSISGCPKTESLKLIAELETYKRQAYTGTIGWWKDNNFSLNIAIRSFMKYKNQLFYHAGCGIVYDSDSQKEWDEFLLKAGSLNLKNTK